MSSAPNLPCLRGGNGTRGSRRAAGSTPQALLLHRDRQMVGQAIGHRPDQLPAPNFLVESRSKVSSPPLRRTLTPASVRLPKSSCGARHPTSQANARHAEARLDGHHVGLNLAAVKGVTEVAHAQARWTSSPIVQQPQTSSSRDLTSSAVKPKPPMDQSRACLSQGWLMSEVRSGSTTSMRSTRFRAAL